jgi:hypothetical protein
MTDPSLHKEAGVLVSQAVFGELKHKEAGVLVSQAVFGELKRGQACDLCDSRQADSYSGVD